MYLKVKWIHDFDDEPIWLYSELDKNRYETRKIEIYKDKSYGYASNNILFNGTKLSILPLPPNDVINKSKEFVLNEINEEDFNILWDIVIKRLEIPIVN